MERYAVGAAVWISPAKSGQWVVEDEAVIVDDLGDGYLVLQVSERIPSHGSGHFVTDVEVEDLGT